MKALRNLNLENVVFIDIETAPVVPNLEEGTPLYDSWLYKTKYSRDKNEFDKDDMQELFKEKAALYAEFSKIVCITIGKVKGENIMLKSFYEDDEKTLLTNFTNTLNGILSNDKNTVLCGHAITGFDIPFIMRRCIVNQVVPCALVDVAHLKPWEVTAVDTMTLWKGSGFTNASLINIAVALGLPSPKYDMAGYDSTKVYYHEQDGLKRIVEYCERDVTTVANIVLACRFENLVTPKSAEIKVENIGVVKRVFNTGKLTKEDEKEITTNYKKLTKSEKEKADDILSLIKN